MIEPLTIVTACSRPENLEKLKNSIDFPCRWIIVHDATEEERAPVFPLEPTWIREYFVPGKISGYPQKNFALDHLKLMEYSGWVYFLDDDNLMHPDWFDTLNKFVEFMPNCRGFIFGQHLPDGSFRINGVDDIRVCHIDQAQYLLHTDLIGKNRYQNVYEGDGHLIEAIFKANQAKFCILPNVISFYNFLSWKL